MSYKYILCMRNLSFEPATAASNRPDVHSFPRIQTTKLRLSFSCELGCVPFGESKNGFQRIQIQINGLVIYAVPFTVDPKLVR